MCMLVHCPGRPRTSNAPDASPWGGVSHPLGTEPGPLQTSRSHCSASSVCCCFLQQACDELADGPTATRRTTWIQPLGPTQQKRGPTSAGCSDTTGILLHIHPHLKTYRHKHYTPSKWTKVISNMSNLSCPGNSLSLGHRRTGAEEPRQQSEHLLLLQRTRVWLSAPASNGLQSPVSPVLKVQCSLTCAGTYMHGYTQT